MFIAKETQTFRSGIYSLPVSIHASNSRTRNQRQLTEEDFGGYPFNDITTNSLVHDFLIPSSTYWNNTFKIKSYGVRENEDDLSANIFENNTLRTIIDDINKNSGDNGFHIVLFVACACGGINPKQYRTEFFSTTQESLTQKFIGKFMKYLVNHVNRTVCTQTLCNIVPETLARYNIQNSDIEKALSEGYCKKAEKGSHVLNTKASSEPRCLYLSAIEVDEYKVFFDRKHIKDWIIGVKSVLPIGWTLDVYDIEDEGKNIEQNYVLLRFIADGVLTDEFHLYFDPSYNFTIPKSAFLSSSQINNQHILFKLDNGKYQIMYKPSCVYPSSQTISNVNTYAYTNESMQISSIGFDNMNNVVFNKTDVDMLVNYISASKCIPVTISTKTIQLGTRNRDIVSFTNIDNQRYYVWRYQLDMPKISFQNLSVFFKDGLYTITLNCTPQQGGFVLENGKVFLVNTNKKHLVQLDKQQQAIIKVKGKNVLIKDIIVKQNKPKTTSTKPQKTNKTKSYKSSSQT